MGDNSDAFPNDDSEITDSDGDGVGDNSDTFPNDDSETTDSDRSTPGTNEENTDEPTPDTNENEGDEKLFSSTGTGFFIGKKNILTNNHVVQDCISINYKFDNTSFETEIVAKNSEIDLATLTAFDMDQDFIQFSTKGATILSDVYVSGFPFGEVVSSEIKINAGRVNALKGLNDDDRIMQIDAPLQPGNSGGQ